MKLLVVVIFKNNDFGSGNGGVQTIECIKHLVESSCSNYRSRV